MKDYGIILLSHSNMCKGLYDTAEMLFGSLDRVIAIPFENNQQIEDYQNEVVKALDELGHDSIILLDLYGGTPFNVILRIAKDVAVNSICGMSLPMLLQAVECRMQEVEAKDAIEKIMNAGREGVADMTPLVERLRKKAEG